jgi:hypothetical protein
LTDQERDFCQNREVTFGEIVVEHNSHVAPAQPVPLETAIDFLRTVVLQLRQLVDTIQCGQDLNDHQRRDLQRFSAILLSLCNLTVQAIPKPQEEDEEEEEEEEEKDEEEEDEEEQPTSQPIDARAEVLEDSRMGEAHDQPPASVNVTDSSRPKEGQKGAGV